MGDRALPGAGDRVSRTLEVAYRHLNRRERTEAELRAHLNGKGFAAEADAALAILHDEGYVDDVRFARMFAQDKRLLEQWGSERIERALLARGIARELAAAAAGDQPPEAEAERARELLERRFRSPPVDARERERALGVLLRKGFDSELAIEAVASYARDAR
ncbi:MAG: RecX family transcriptional regulator [Actinomycetota bacterium]|nr:RecX family transcriptional regulator [Actinomycetota bacterium]